MWLLSTFYVPDLQQKHVRVGRIQKTDEKIDQAESTFQSTGFVDRVGYLYHAPGNDQYLPSNAFRRRLL